MSDQRGKANLPRGPQIYVLCRKCGQRIGEVALFTDGTRFVPGMAACLQHGPCKQPTKRELAIVEAQARRNNGPVPLRVWPVR